MKYILIIIVSVICIPFSVFAIEGTGAPLQQREVSNADLAGAVIMPAFEKDISPVVFGKKLCEMHAISYMILRPDWNKKMLETVQKTYDATCGPHTFKLLVSIDAEPSLLKTRIPKLILPKTSALTTTKKAYATAKTIAGVLHTAGITITFAPVYDSNQNTIIIGNRSFGSSSKIIAELGRAYQQGTEVAGVYPTAKHFPGHGHALGDTHSTLQSIPGTLPELDQFKSAINDKVPLVMVGHLVVKGGEWDSAQLPASLSPIIITKLLKDNLHYEGVVITDALNMGAVASNAFATRDALSAGADIALYPKNTKDAYASVLAKISTDDVFKKQLLISYGKIIKLRDEIILK